MIQAPELSTFLPYVGGEIEIDNKKNSSIFRGEIESVEIKEGGVYFKLKWLVKGDARPTPSVWHPNRMRSYAVGLSVYTVSAMEPDGENSQKLQLHSETVQETATLFPPDGSKLNQELIQKKELVD